VAIALAPDGTLYAWDGRTIATVRAETMEIGPTAVVHPRSPNGAVSAAVAPDGTVVTVAGDAVAELDAGSFAPTAAWSLPAPASSVALSTDGRTLYAVTGAQIIAVDRTSHTEIGRVAAAPGDRIAAVLQQP
jgi:DNA-binding beta-propeller fold protein YncE